MRVLAVVPAFNEEECLEGTIASLKAACPDIDYLVVNDGSKDATREIIAKNRFNGANLPINTGLTSAFRTGMKYAWRHGYDAVVQFDADGQHLPCYIPQMAQVLEEKGADVVIGSRYLDGTQKPSGARGAGSRLITWLIKLFCKGFDWAPEPDLVAIVARKYGPVVEIQTQMQERQGGESYLKLGNVIRYMSRTCLSIVMSRFLR